MRLWSLHPKYLDAKGLVALWREALLAQAVLRGETRGYRNHPQLDRFRQCPSPLSALSLYLESVYAEAQARGYAFNRSKIQPAEKPAALEVGSGQLDHEWAHLLAKLKARSPTLHEHWRSLCKPEPHPLFHVVPGPIAPWERP